MFVSDASYCTVLLDSTFILEGVRERLKDIKDEGVNEELPFAKFFFGETEELANVAHKRVPERLKAKLDDSQRKAFDAALDKDITLIWGPPGTRKSHTRRCAIYKGRDTPEQDVCRAHHHSTEKDGSRS